MCDGTRGPLSGQGCEGAEGVVVGEDDVGIEEDEQLGQELGKERSARCQWAGSRSRTRERWEAIDGL